MATNAVDRVDEVRRNVHEWGDRTVTGAVASVLFYAGLAITVLGLVVVVASLVLSWR